MTTASSVERKVWTEAELQALPEDGYIHEVVDGDLVMSPKNDPYHGDICAELSMALRAFAKARKLGRVWTPAPAFGCITATAVRRTFLLSATSGCMPWISSRRHASSSQARPIWPSKSSRPTTRAGILTSAFGTSSVVGLRLPGSSTPTPSASRCAMRPTSASFWDSGAELEGEHLLPGFRYPIADLFKVWY